MRRNAFERLELLIGTGALEALGRTRVILFGLGGVGSWCAEGLIRDGVGRLALVDGDRVSPSNVNRQLVATSSNAGTAKVDAAAARLSDINPEARIEPVAKSYGPGTAGAFDLGSYDYVIDAIDTLNSKVTLIENALASGATLLSALGASRKLDPTRVRTGPFWEVRGCPLGKHLRKRLRNRGATGEFDCVYSEENLLSMGDVSLEAEEEGKSDGHKRVNGSAVHVTSVFGMVLAGLVVDRVVGDVRAADAPR